MLNQCYCPEIFDQNEAKAASACIIKLVVECGEEGKAAPKKSNFRSVRLSGRQTCARHVSGSRTHFFTPIIICHNGSNTCKQWFSPFKHGLLSFNDWPMHKVIVAA